MTRFYLVGAGPGDPELLTVKALRLLQRAGAVLYDRLVSPEILALINPRAERLYTGKGEGEQELVQGQIHEQLLACAAKYEVVVRLKGGDPMVFGRGAEEMLFLAARGYAVEAVPGISSAIGVPELAGIPVTLRGVARSFAVVTGHDAGGVPEDWSAYRGIDTLVILMGVKHRALIAARLIAAGRSAAEPVAFVERGSTARERVTVTTLGGAAAAQVEAPAVFVVGEVVRVRERLLASAEALAA